MAHSIAEALIRQHEGVRYTLYECPAGFWTIGVGRNLETRGISEDECELMLANDIKLCVADLSTLPWFNTLSEPRQAALIDLRFCVGGGGFRKYKKMIAAIEDKDFGEAGRQIMDSQMARATPGGKRRCQELARLMEQG